MASPDIQIKTEFSILKPYQAILAIGAGIALGSLFERALWAILAVSLSLLGAGCGAEYESPGERCERAFEACVERHGANHRAVACRDNYAVCMTQATAQDGGQR